MCKRVISLSLIVGVCLLSATLVKAQNKVVVIPLLEEKVVFIGVGKSGSTVCTSPGAGDHWNAISCNLLSAPLNSQDAKLRAGAQITPRFKDLANGTVRDRLTGLIWLRNAHCAQTSSNWPTALAFIAELNASGTMNSNSCGDTSNKGEHRTDWRLPNVKELQSLLNYGDHGSPYISDLSGTGHFPEQPPFLNLQTSNAYWSSTTHSVGTSSMVDDDFYDNALRVSFGDAVSDSTAKGVGTIIGIGEFSWAVRAGK